MANHTITIQGINSDGTLKLSDGGVTTAAPGDTVTWVIGNNSGVAAIKAIVDNSSVNVFNPDPAPVAGSTNWQGTVNPIPPTSPQIEKYTIHYKTSGDSKVHSYDPEIDVNPE